jgi:hypothetical protein
MPLPIPSPLKALNFTTLAQQIYTYTPSPPPPNSNPTNPDLILLCTWLGAEPRHISKYAFSFQKLYPTSPILILTTELSDLLLLTNASNYSRLQPALKILTSPSPNPKPKLLISIYSNAGSITLSVLASQYVKKKKKNRKASPSNRNPIRFLPGARKLVTYVRTPLQSS